MLVRSKSGSLLLAGILGSLALAGATPANAATEAGIGLTLNVRDVDEEGTWSNGDEVFISVVRDGSTQRYAPTEGTIDVNESDEGHQVEIPSSNPLKFPVGSKVTIQVWEDDVSGDDLLAEARDVVVECDRPFSGVTEITKRKYYDYAFDGKFTCW
ncbi:MULTISPECIES: hypothetical protein [Streptosporangium]|uniref:Secreted protein n=1 Tax=Streptosporangium brasiliense TaxID=47480 RepID=A0ABT9RMQ2_9ACTN|nr:hypothetical protein [Streptosporangium brasiliense]MDP9869600.1 hypothetical protein [Streptosporangium brasiliense]